MSPKKKTKKKATETEIPQVNQEVPKAAEVKSEAPKAEDKPKAPKQAKSWFAKKVEAKEIGHWQAPEIQAFFKKKGLSESENPDSYEEQLKSY